MSDEPENLVLAILRRVEDPLTRVEAKIDRLNDQSHDTNLRLAHVEENLAGVHRGQDRSDVRLDRIEKRLDLTDA